MMVESWVSARQGYSQTWWGSKAIPWLFSLLIPSFFSFEPCIETKKSVDLRLNNNTFWVLKIQPNAAEGRGGGGLPMMACTGGSARKGYLFQASGIWKGRDFTRWSIQMGMEICYLGLWKGPKHDYTWILWRYKVEKTFYFCEWFLFNTQCIYSSYKGCKVLNKVYESGTICR